MEQKLGEEAFRKRDSCETSETEKSLSFQGTQRPMWLSPARGKVAHAWWLKVRLYRIFEMITLAGFEKSSVRSLM